VLNGRFGPYIAYKKKNYRIAKDVDPHTMTYEDCLKVVEATAKTTPAKRRTVKKK
jgi:DNA topoisomerase-1